MGKVVGKTLFQDEPEEPQKPQKKLTTKRLFGNEPEEGSKRQRSSSSTAPPPRVLFGDEGEETIRTGLVLLSMPVRTMKEHCLRRQLWIWTGLLWSFSHTLHFYRNLSQRARFSDKNVLMTTLRGLSRLPILSNMRWHHSRILPYSPED